MKKPTQKRFADVLASPGFLIGLALLVINDYYLKQNFSGVISGKLSDFAGLFVVGLLIVSSHPKKSIYWLPVSALAFAFWKSPLCNVLIDVWNSLNLFPVARVVDYSDLIALVALPAAHLYYQHCKPLFSTRLLLVPVAGITLLGIMGTSVPMYSLQLDVVEKESKATASGAQLDALLHRFFTERGLRCIECEPNSSYRYYRSHDVSVQVNVDPTTRKTFLSLHSTRKYEQGKALLEAMKADLEEEIRRSASAEVLPISVSRWSPIQERRIKIVWPTSELSFLGLSPVKSNPEVTETSEFIVNYLDSRLQVTPSRWCGASHFARKVCREYVAGKIIGPWKESFSTEVRISGDSSWWNTSLSIEFKQFAEDKSIDVVSMANDLYSQLQKRLSQDATLSQE